MTSRQTAPEPPVTLPDPTRPPRPAPGCDVCAALDRQRAEAEKDGDIRRATTLGIEMRGHHALPCEEAVTVETRQDTGSSFAWCAWHQGYTRRARLVRDPADQGSGAGAPGLFACAPCRYAYDLAPIGDES